MKFYEKIIDGNSIIPSAFFLITAHHPPCQLNRTWRFTVFGHRIYICTRCFGQYAGMLITIAGVLFTDFQITGLKHGILFFGLLPLPSTIDWLTQTVFRRESLNPIRFSSGVLFGTSLGLVVGNLLIGNFPVLWMVIPIYGLYLTMVMLCLVQFRVLDSYLKPYEEFVNQENSD